MTELGVMPSGESAEAATPVLSVVVPCYNEAACLRELQRRTRAACDALGMSYELVLVNDGSSDGSWAIMLELAAQDPRLVAVNLSRNHGHQLALTAGLSVCRGQWILVLDADLQDPPELVGPMLELARREGADVVSGQRLSRKGETWHKRATARVFYRLINRLSEVAIPVDTGDFRLMSRRALDALQAMPERHRFIRGMISWIGYRQVPMPYERDARFADETKYPFRKMLRFAIDAITSFSVRPLQWASFLGLAFGALSLLLIVYALASWLRGEVVPGWTSLMIVVTVLGAAHPLMMGLFGEYLGRLYEQSKGRPLFLIERVVRHEDAASAPTAQITSAASSE